jgi:hypothetical protein
MQKLANLNLAVPQFTYQFDSGSDVIRILFLRAQKLNHYRLKPVGSKPAAG